MEKRLFLIDGHALIFKIYYAFLRRPMINSKGADMSILFGFTKNLLELIEKEKPTHLAVAFDPPGGTFRHQMYPDYKGTRQATPQLIIDALQPLIEICQSLDIPVLMIPGFEADDVIGSMAVKAQSWGFDTFMVTPDKDYGQLITDHIFQIRPGKGRDMNELVDSAKVCEKYGISKPSQVVEILTLCGDTSDNVPGVKGIGEVGAGKLIAKFGTVESIYAHIDELSPKQKEAFENAREHISLSHFLVTIKTDIPLETTQEQMKVNCTYNAQVAALFDKYEFSSLKKYLPGDGVVHTPERRTLKIEHTSMTKVAEAARKSGKCAIIIEGERGDIFSTVKKVTVACANMEASSGIVAEGTAAESADILADSGIAKFGYDLKFQRNILLHEGMTLGGHLYDIELMHYIIDPEKSHKAEILSRAYLDYVIGENGKSATDIPTELSLFDEIPEQDSDNSELATVYALLGEKVMDALVGSGLDKLYCEIEEPLLRVLSDMETEGVKVDLAQLRKYSASLSAEMNGIQERVQEMAGEPNLNIMSPKQIGTLLFEKLNLNPKIKPKSGVRYVYPTDEETLSALSDKSPIIGEILEYRAVKKLLSTYIEPLPTYIKPQTGKIHTTFNQALTATGRLSSSKPNLQNIPIRTERGKEIRKAFIPSHPGGRIISADYSQIELRIMAHLSCDSHLIEAFKEGQDVHRTTASKIFGIPLEEVTDNQRRIAKTANFGIMYGISAFGLSQRLKIARTEAKKIIEDYFASFPAISSYIEDTLASARECGYVETIFGRRRYLPDINSRNATVRSLAERNAVNAPIQGSSADIIKIAMINVDRRIAAEGLKSRMILQIHDELVFDAVAEEVEILKRIAHDEMENVVKLSVPLTVECNDGNNWLEAH